MVEWRRLDRLPDYEISENGDVRRWKVRVRGTQGVGIILKGCCDSDGYLKFKLTFPDGVKRGVYAHRLCCEAFHGPAPDDKPHAAHGDGDIEHNHFSNLRWATVQENSDDKVRHLMARRRRSISASAYNAGEENGFSKITAEQARLIRSAGGDVRKRQEVAEQIGLGRDQARRIALGKAWRCLADVERAA